jgi:hypothetical protein
MNVFRSKIGNETLLEEEVPVVTPEGVAPVDNLFQDYILEDIMEGNETTSS